MNRECRAFCQKKRIFSFKHLGELNTFQKLNKVIFLLLEPASLKSISPVLSWQAELQQNWITTSLIIKPKKILGVIDYHQPKLAVIVGGKEQATGLISIRDCLAKKVFLVERGALVGWINNYLNQNKTIYKQHSHEPPR